MDSPRDEKAILAAAMIQRVWTASGMVAVRAGVQAARELRYRLIADLHRTTSPCPGLVLRHRSLREIESGQGHTKQMEDLKLKALNRSLKE